jgi:hypothetical protein
MAQAGGMELPARVGSRWGDGWEIYVQNPSDKTASGVQLTIHQTHPRTGNQFVTDVIWLGDIEPRGDRMAKFNCPENCRQFLATARAQEMR